MNEKELIKYLIDSLELLKFALTDDVTNNDGNVDFAACYGIIDLSIAKAKGCVK